MKKKFRGIYIGRKEYIYGYGFYVAADGEVYIYDEETEEWLEVIPMSLVQLVGYDCDGTELYENDLVTGPNEFDYKVLLKMDYELYSGNDKFISQFKKKNEE